MMTTHPSFNVLLRRYRKAASLTQGELAALAEISERAFSDLERGKSLPRPGTLRLLAEALTLQGERRAEFIASAAPLPSQPSQGGNPAQRHNLPSLLTSLIGRDKEIADVGALITEERLVSLTGPAGCGKTRLALAVGERQRAAFPAGVWFVELAATTDPARIPQQIAHALGVREQAGQRLLDTILAWASGKRFLLLLDNCEHLLDACRQVALELVTGCPDARFLITSRAPLHIDGEHRYTVPPLALPPVTRRPSVAAVQRAEATELFVARARLVLPDFAVTPGNVATLAQVCQRLEGLPLALELAAARLDLLAIGQVEERLDQLLILLPKIKEGSPSPHRTLRAALDWSHDLLGPTERVVLRRLAVFAGGCSLAAAEAVCAGEDVPTERILPALGQLVQHSLVNVAPDKEENNRYRLLEPIRQYAAEHLTRSGEGALVGRRHCDWYIALADLVATPLDGGEAAWSWLADLDGELANIWSALDWARTNDRERGLRLVGSFWPYYFCRGDFPPGRALLTAMLDAGDDTRGRARVLYGLGVLSVYDDMRFAHTTLTEALALATAEADEALIPELHWPLAFTGLANGEIEEARAHLAAGEASVAQGNRPARRTAYLMLRGIVTLGMGRLAEGRAQLAVAHAASREHDQPIYQCIILSRLSGASLKLGKTDEALVEVAALQQAADRLGSWFYRIVALQRFGTIHEWLGDFDEADDAYRRALELNCEAGGNRIERALALMALGRVALYREASDQALALLQETAALVAQLRHHQLLRELAFPLGLAFWRAGQRNAARVELNKALDLRASGGDHSALLICLEGMAALAIAAGAATAGARWLSATAVARSSAGIPRPHVEGVGYCTAHAAAEAALGPTAHAEAQRGGAELGLREMVGEIRHWLDVA